MLQHYVEWRSSELESVVHTRCNLGVHDFCARCCNLSPGINQFIVPYLPTENKIEFIDWLAGSDVFWGWLSSGLLVMVSWFALAGWLVSWLESVG